MFQWVIKISAFSIIFTLVSYFIPKGALHKAALTALSIIFASFLLLPLKNYATELINKKIVLDTERNNLISQTEEGKFDMNLIEHYKNRLYEETTKALESNNYKCNSIVFTINEDISSREFGKVINVVCDVSAKENKENLNSVEKVKVPQIIINKDGISINSNDDENENNESKESIEVSKIIQSLTGVDANRIIIRWSDL